VLLYSLSDLFLSGISTGITVRLDVNNVRQLASVLGYFFNVNSSSDVEPTIADEDSDSWLFRLVSRLG
jgi:hypothetical protein